METRRRTWICLVAALSILASGCQYDAIGQAARGGLASFLNTIFSTVVNLAINQP